MRLAPSKLPRAPWSDHAYGSDCAQSWLQSCKTPLVTPENFSGLHVAHTHAPSLSSSLLRHNFAGLCFP